MNWDITEIKSNNIIYLLMPVFTCVDNARSLLHLLLLRHKFRARNNHCSRGTIAHKIGTSATSLLRCMENSTKLWNSMGQANTLDMTVGFPTLIAFIMLTWIRAISAFPLLMSGYGLFGILVFCVGQTQETFLFYK